LVFLVILLELRGGKLFFGFFEEGERGGVRFLSSSSFF
jgi:hypothetical protein